MDAEEPFLQARARRAIPLIAAALTVTYRRHGIVYAGKLYRTVGGGSHWEVVSLPDATPIFDFASPTRGWAVDSVDGRRVYRTDDGGLTWRMLPAALPASTAHG